MSGLISLSRRPVSDTARAALGFGFGLLLMLVATRVFLVNPFDFNNMRRGVELLSSGVSPWAAQSRIPDFYNPPFAVLFLWPMAFATPQAYLSIGAACLFAFVFYHRAWVALSWFATNTVLWLIAAGGVDMFLVGAGLLLLLAGDRTYTTKRGLALRVLAYGLLMVKPQGGVFIVALYILTRLDWKGALISFVIYGVLFLPMYPDWIYVITHDPPLAQSEATHTLWGRYGPTFAVLVAMGATVSRRWQYWQLGGALAGILTPYGMPGIPSLLTLTSVKSLKAIPIVVIWSAGLAVLTWVTPPEGVDYYDYLSPLMAIFHLSMFGLALAFACLSPDDQGPRTIAVNEWVRRQLSRARRHLKAGNQVDKGI
jgi:hypothetical protein